MKKYLLILVASFLLVPNTFAATLFSDYSISMGKYEAVDLAPMTITSTIQNDITSQYGIRLMLDSNLYILWNQKPVTLSGSAVDSGKVEPNTLVYSKDYKSIFIPVKSNFESNDQLQLSGLSLRAYDQDFDHHFIGMDLNGDSIVDVSDINGYEVNNLLKTDHTAPYPVQDVVSKLNEDQSITLTWHPSPDYDYNATVVNRITLKNGVEEIKSVYNDFSTQFTDVVFDLFALDNVKYQLFAVDKKGNWSEPVEIKVNLASDQMPPADQPTENPSDTVDQNDPWVKKLESLIKYFYLRFEVDCNSDLASDYSCLWARIRLIHAQELTELYVVPTLKLSQGDLDQMSFRRKWPELRYKETCIGKEDEPQCVRLKEDLDRLSYFLD